MTLFTVSQLNRHVRTYLEHEIGEVRVSGEISNLSKPASGHFYFTLKDAVAQIRCVYFRNRHARSIHPGDQDVRNGQQVIVRGQLSLYEARGDYQLIIEQLDDAGLGDLYRQFELLKTKLAALGWFDEARKKQRPRIPVCIGVITSNTGAALQDILTTLGRRFPLVPVIVYSSDVQGKQAAPQLINALNYANRDKRCDVLILARGGGSIEDLWAFNDERLAYAIVTSSIPIVSGIGHETDFTIADFVADFRAATPTAAAEAVVPDRQDLIVRVNDLQVSLFVSVSRYIRHKRLLLSHEIEKIASPGRLINTYWQKIDYLERHLHQVQAQALSQRRHRLCLVLVRLNAKNPRLLFQHARGRFHQLEARLIQKMDMIVYELRQRFVQKLATMHAVSPLATLERGYAIVMFGEKIVFDSHQVRPGDEVSVRLAKGSLLCEIK